MGIKKVMHKRLPMLEYPKISTYHRYTDLLILCGRVLVVHPATVYALVLSKCTRILLNRFSMYGTEYSTNGIYGKYLPQWYTCPGPDNNTP